MRLVRNSYSFCLIISDDCSCSFRLDCVLQTQLFLHKLRKAVMHLRHPVNPLCQVLYFTHSRWCSQLSDGLIVFSPAWPVALRAIFTADKRTDPCPAVLFSESSLQFAFKGWNPSAEGTMLWIKIFKPIIFHQPTWVTLINGLASMFWLDVNSVCLRPYEAKWKPFFPFMFFAVRQSSPVIQVLLLILTVNAD